MRWHLLLAPAHHDVLQEVDGQVVAVGEVRLRVDGEEDVDLALGAELGAEDGGGDRLLDLLLGLHD